MMESDDPLWPQVLELLAAMEDSLLPLHARSRKLLLEALKLVDDPSGSILRSSGAVAITPAAFELLMELHDSLTVLLLRVQQVHKLYRSRGSVVEGAETTSALQSKSRELIQHASTIVLEREKRYRVDVNRIGGMLGFAVVIMPSYFFD